MNDSVLYIGSDIAQYAALKELLDEYEVVYTAHLTDGLRQFNQRSYCLIIIDLLLAEAGRPELLQAIRRANSVPIIALHDYTDDEDIVRILNSGADIPLHRAVSPAVLEAHARSLVTRYTLLDHLDREGHIGEALLRVGDFEVDLKRRRVSIRGNPIKLSCKEYDLLCFFVRNPDRVLTEEQIYERVWHTAKDYHSSITKPIHRLRQKIEPDLANPVYIRSVRGTGYRFTPVPAELCDI